MATPPRPRRYWGLSAERFLRVVQEGPLDALLGEATAAWRSFFSELIERGADRAVLRLYEGEDAAGPYFLWLVYRLVPAGDEVTLRLEAMVFPTEDARSRLETPEGLEREPFFAYPPGEARSPR